MAAPPKLIRATTRALLLAALVTAVVGAQGAWRWVEAERLNRLIEARSGRLAESASPYAVFAQAVALDDAHRLLDSLAAYRRVIESGPRPLAVAAWFNSGNAHFRQAEALSGDSSADPEQVHAAAELAKACYRSALRLQPDYWSARYNLERALERFPDAEEEDLGEAPPLNRERAVTTMRGQFQGLP